LKDALAPLMSMPMPMFPEMRLPVPLAVPPMVLPEELTVMPLPPLASAVVPGALVPT